MGGGGNDKKAKIRGERKKNCHVCQKVKEKIPKKLPEEKKQISAFRGPF